MSISLAVAACGLLFFIGHGLEAIFKRYRIPDILPLIVLGYIAGPLAGWVQAEGVSAIEHLFGHVALIVILFHGGLDLKFDLIQKSALSALRLSMGLMAVNVATIAAIAHFAGGQPWPAGILLGVVLAPTAASVVIPMLEHLRLPKHLGSVITIESAIGDVFAVVGVITLTKVILGTGGGIGAAIGTFLSSFLVAAFMGVASAFLWSFVIPKLKAFQKMAFATEAMLLVVAGITEWLGYSGPISALAFGVGLKNLDRFAQLFPSASKWESQGLSQVESDLLHEAVFILKVFFFFYLGTLLHLNHLAIVGFALLVTVSLVVARLVYFKGVGTLSEEPKAMRLAAWLVPKGLASAVIAGVPMEAGIAGGVWIRDIAFAVIPLSILATTIGIVWTERRSKALGVSPEPPDLGAGLT